MKTKAILFLVIFASFLVAPTVVTFMDHQVDVSYVFSLAEEENKKSKEVELYAELRNNIFSALDIFKRTFIEYGNLTIKPVYLNLISPPPKL